MQKHLILTTLAYFAFGFGLGVEVFGHKAGLEPEFVLVIFASSLIFFLFVVFTSMEKVKEVLFKKEPTAKQ